MNPYGIHVTYNFRHGRWFAHVAVLLTPGDMELLTPEAWLKSLLILVRVQSSGAPRGQFVFGNRLVSPKQLVYDSSSSGYRFSTDIDVSPLIPQEPFFICIRGYSYQSPITLLDPNHEK